jgi:S-adenosylmethionine:diacylglycerol 3-amino-3-carboxypropyl transferase
MSAGRPAYSEVMEDYAVLADALQPREGDTVVAVSSAGDNVFNAALDPARHVFGVDVQPAQTALCRLKEAAVRELDWEGLAALLGALPAAPDARRELLERLPGELVDDLCADPAVRANVEQHGLAACGQLAAFVAPLREGLLQLVGVGPMEAILTCGDPAERAARFDRHLDTPAVLELLAAGLNEQTISDAFIPASAWERMAETSFHRFYHGVLRHLLVEQDPRTNYFLHRLWLGRFPGPDAVPPYLRREHHARLRQRLDRISWHTADLASFLGTLPERSVDVLNLTNVLDWCADDHHDALWAQVDRVAAPGARVFLRSFLRERPLPPGLEARWPSEPARSVAMARADRVGYYARYELRTRVRDRG